MLPNFTLLLVSSAVLFVNAQDSSSSALAAYPECAQSCLIQAIEGKLCSPTDPVCMCTYPAYLSNVTACVSTTCTPFESLTTQNISSTNCGAPVRDRSQTLMAQSIALFVFASFFVILRTVYKAFMKLSFGMDDYFLLATYIITIPNTAMYFVGTGANGLGRDIYTLKAQQITDFLMYWYISAIFYFLQTTLVKLTFVSFYMRIFTTQNSKRLLWGTFVCVTLWGIAFVTLAIFVCTPVGYMWKQWDGLHKGKCVDDAAYVWTNAITNIAFDLWILAVPLWELRRLQLHWKKKVGVAVMFSLGAFVTVMSILRLKSLVLYQHRSLNVTYEFSDVFLWSTIEIDVGMVCACLPTVRVILVRIWPVLSGSKIERSHQWYRSGKGSDGPGETMGSYAGASRVSRQRTQVHVGAGKPDPADRRQTEGTTKGGKPAGGIGLKQSFSVYYSEGSDISLVSINGATAEGGAKPNGRS